MPSHTVQQGDCIASIATQHGLFWETVWNHPDNAELKRKRANPNHLLPGDVVSVPDKRLREESGPTESKQRFRRKGVPAMLRLRIMQPPEDPPAPPPATQGAAAYPPPKDVAGEDPQSSAQSSPDTPRANVPYVLDIDGALSDGTTDGQGQIEVRIPPGARRGRLTVEPGTPRETIIPLSLGHLDPITEISGVKQRLANLGFDPGELDASETGALENAVRAFQEKHALEATGRVDDALRSKLEEVHGR